MRTLNISGTLPATIVENTAPWEWAGGVALLEDPAIVRFVEVDGFAGNFFEAVFDSRTGFISIRPSARMDAEWFTANGLSTSLNLSLRFFLTDGTQATGSTSFTVGLQNIDDTAPEALAFATGGRVRAGVAGAEIGRLAVTDRDTTSGFTFQLAEADAWQFEVVNGVLRLRSGVSVSMADGPQRSVTVLVSDGRQDAALTVHFDVLPGTTSLPQEPVNYLLPGSPRGGFAWGGSASPFPWTPSDAVVSYVPAWDITSVTTSSALVRIELENRSSVIFDKPRTIDLTSGVIDFRPDSAAASLWLLWETILDREPTLLEYQEGVWHLTVWATPRVVADLLLTTGESGKLYTRLNNAQFVREVYGNVISWDIGNDVVNWHASRLDQGLTSRTDFVLGIIDWRRGMQDFQDEVAGGIYVPRRHMVQIGAALEIAANLELGEFAYYWAWAFDVGTWSYRGMAQALLNIPEARQKWAGVSDRDFFLIATRELFNMELPEQHVAWWQWAVRSGVQTYGDFLGMLLEAMPADGSFHSLPQGNMFASIW